MVQIKNATRGNSVERISKEKWEKSSLRSSEALWRTGERAEDARAANREPGFQKVGLVCSALPQICVQLLLFCIVLWLALSLLFGSPGFLDRRLLETFSGQPAFSRTPARSADPESLPNPSQADVKDLLKRMSHILSVMAQNGAQFSVCRAPGMAVDELKACMGQIRCEATRNWIAMPEIADSHYARVRFHQILSALTSQVQAQHGDVSPRDVMRSALQIRLQCEDFFYNEEDKTRMETEMMEILGPFLKHFPPSVSGGREMF